MTTKVHGAAYAGIWVEKQVTFVKMTFNKNIKALLDADLHVLGTPAVPVAAGNIANSEFAVVESVMVSALKTLATRSTILAISTSATGLTYDVMLGHAASWFSAGDAAGLPDAVTGLITPTAIPVIGAQAVVTTAGAAPTSTVGALVSVVPGAVTFDMNFVYMNGTMADATGANGALVNGPGSTSGAYPMNSPTGTPGFYPKAV